MFRFGNQGGGNFRGHAGTMAAVGGGHFCWRRTFLNLSLVVVSAFLVSLQAAVSGNGVASVSSQRLLHPVPAFQELRHEVRKAVSLQGSSSSIVKWLRLFYFTFLFF